MVRCWLSRTVAVTTASSASTILLRSNYITLIQVSTATANPFGLLSAGRSLSFAFEQLGRLPRLDLNVQVIHGQFELQTRRPESDTRFGELTKGMAACFAQLLVTISCCGHP